MAFFLLTVLPLVLINSIPFDCTKTWLAGVVTFLALCFSLFYFLANKNRPQLFFSRIDILLLLYYLTYLVSGNVAIYKEVAFLTVMNEFVFIFLYLFFRVWFLRHSDIGPLLYYFISITVVVLSLWALAQYFFHFGVTDDLKELFKTNHYPVIASFGNPNFLAEFLVLALPVTMYGLRKKTVYFVAVFIVQGLAIFVTYSRLAWAIMAIFMLVSCVGINKQERIKIVTIYTILVIILGIFFLNHHKAGTTKSKRIVKSISKNIFFNERKLIYMTALHMLRDSSGFGKGPGYFSLQYLEYQGKTARVMYKNLENHDFIDLDHAHSDIIETGIDSGYAAMVLYVLLLLYAAYTGLKLFFKDNDNSIGLILLLAVPFSIWAFPNYLLFSKMLILLALAFISGKSGQYGFFFQRTICVLFILTGIVAVFFQTRYFTSALFYQKGLGKFMEYKAIEFFKRGMDFCPENGLNHFAVGSYLLNRGDFAGIEYIEKSLNLISNSTSYLYLARAYKNYDMPEKAKYWYEKYLFIRPDDKFARIEYEDLLFEFF